jgi:hypothetical protein
MKKKTKDYVLEALTSISCSNFFIVVLRTKSNSFSLKSKQC